MSATKPTTGTRLANSWQRVGHTGHVVFCATPDCHEEVGRHLGLEFFQALIEGYVRNPAICPVCTGEIRDAQNDYAASKAGW